MKKFVSVVLLSVLLLATWLAFVGFVSVLTGIFAILACFLSILMYYKTHTTTNNFPLMLHPYFFYYKICLIRDIFKSGFSVAFLAFSSKKGVESLKKEYCIKSLEDNNFKLSLFANSITITPGSLVVDVYEAEGRKKILVHALKIRYFDDLSSVQLQNNINRLFK
jgi:multisubunit Na+/H+ antiporter MnhE subunit